MYYRVCNMYNNHMYIINSLNREIYIFDINFSNK